MTRNAEKEYETYADGSNALAGVLPSSEVLYSGTLSPTDKVVAAYLTAIAAIAVISASRAPAWPLFVAGHAAVIAALIIIARRFNETAGRAGVKGPAPLSRTAVAVRFVRSWYPLVLVPSVYKELEYLVPRVHPRDLDMQLAAIDYKLFGVNPTVWLERVTFPALTEVLQLAYVSYYFLPLAVGVPLWLQGRHRQYHLLLFALVLCFFLSYFGYLTVPAVGPRFILNDQQTFSLEGVLLYAPIRSTLDWAEGITRDCFPSGHTAIAVLVLIYAWRFHRRIFWSLLPIGILLVLSTVYLRYHYVIDVIAGVGLALLVTIASKPLYRLLGGEPAE